jgi:hypothetical protein
MPTRHLFSCATLALAFCASGAFAADGCRTVANGVQKCDVATGQERARDDVVAEIRAKTDNATGCRTVANGVQKCDVVTGGERSRAEVVAEIRAGSTDGVQGCRTVANGVQKCDLPASYRHADTALAKAHSAPAETH